MHRILSTVILSLALGLYAWAGDVVVLSNGFTLRFDHREVKGENTRLFTDADGRAYIDVPTKDIDHFERSTENGPEPVMNQMEPEAPPAVAQAPVLPQFTAPAVAPVTRDLSTLVRDASFKVKLDPDLVNSVIRYESGGNSRAVSNKGALGLMQLMPDTARKLGVSNAFNPEQNVEAGTKYLRTLLEQFNFDLVKALAAYNAGPQVVLKYKGVPPYQETRQYVSGIVKDYNRKKLAAQKSKKTAPAATAKPSPAQQTAQARQ